jgi:hypothetical protein
MRYGTRCGVSVCIHRRGLAEPVPLTYRLREIVDAPDACNENFVASVQPPEDGLVCPDSWDQGGTAVYCACNVCTRVKLRCLRLKDGTTRSLPYCGSLRRLGCWIKRVEKGSRSSKTSFPIRDQHLQQLSLLPEHSI